MNVSRSSTLFFQVTICIVDVFIGLSVADSTGHPAQTVIVPGADVGMFSLCIGRLLIHRLTEYVAGALQLSSVPVDVQGQVALLVIPEGLCAGGAGTKVGLSDPVV